MNWFSSLARRLQKPKFVSVPDWLTERVSEIGRTNNVLNRGDVYYHAAGWVIAQYLHKDVSKADSDGYFDAASVKGTDLEWHRQVNRVILTGETLFMLRATPGFAEFCRRLKERDVRPAFFEMLTAKQFFKAGFEIHATSENQKLGEDFDFVAKRDAKSINVEVTALTAPSYSENTVLTALKRKRSQLPKSAPAVICCVIPEKWIEDGEANWERIEKPVMKFLAGTERINVVKIWCERNSAGPDGQGAALMMRSRAFNNTNARFDADGVDFLFSGIPLSHGMMALKNGEGLGALVEASYQSEFFRWVDYLVPRTSDAGK